MADNVAITAGAGTTIAADDIAGVLHQRVKISQGADGSATDVSAAAPLSVKLTDGTNPITIVQNAPSTNDYAAVVAIHPDSVNANGQATAANSAPVVIASDRQNSVVYSVAMSIDTAAYASGDLIADTQQLDAFFNKADGRGVINSITIVDSDALGVALYVLFHSTSTSMGTENSAPNISDANLIAGLQGIVAVATTDYVTVSGTKVACIRNIGLPVKAVSGTDDLYVSILNGTGAPDWTASTLDLTIGALLD